MVSKGKPEKAKPLVGFVHKLSPIKRGQKVEYCELELQLVDRHVKTLCFSKRKRDLLLQNQNNLTPVKLTNYIHGKSIYNTDEDIIKINDQTAVEKAQPSECRFQYKDDEDVKITTLGQLQHVQFGEMINLKAKVCRGAKVELAGEGKLRKLKCAVNDGTSSDPIIMMIWQAEIDEIADKQVYTMYNVRVRSEGAGKILTTTPNTIRIVHPDDELGKLDDSKSEALLKDADGERSVDIINFRSVSVVKCRSCISCKKKVQQVLHSKIVKCDRCQRRMRYNDCPVLVIAEVSFVNKADETEEYDLTAFTEVLEKFEHKLEDLTEDEIAEKLLDVQNVSVTFNKNDNIITKIVSSSNASAST